MDYEYLPPTGRPITTVGELGGKALADCAPICLKSAQLFAQMLSYQSLGGGGAIFGKLAVCRLGGKQ